MEDVAGRRAASITFAGIAVIVVVSLAVLLLTTSEDASAVAPAGRSQSCTPQASPEPSTQTIDVEGVTRQYRVAMPARSGNALRPLILNFHGFGRDDVTQASYSELEKKGPARGFVVITPNAGNPPAWGRLDVKVFEASDANLAFTRALIDAAAAGLCIDTHRVYATGFSAGAAMSKYLGCSLDRQIAAIAPVSGINLGAPCPRGKPISVVAFHGTADSESLYEGDSRPSVLGGTFEYPSVEAAVRVWAQRAECRTKPSRKTIGTEVERIAYRGCARSTDVVLYKVVNGAHNWPGSFELDDLGLPTQDINAADLILDFFSQHPRPAKNAKS